MRVLVIALLAASLAAPALAHDGAHRRHDSRGPAFQGQADVPGDFRCDAYRDRGRTDCDAGWRDQRQWSSRGPDHGQHPNVWRSGAQGGEVWRGAWGRPDLVYSGAAIATDRDPRRIDWCRATYRSYDPASGYYRAHSGRDVFCG